MKIKPARTAGKTAFALLTILAIAGTLTACGRYGRPVRPKAAPSTLKIEMKAQDARIERPIRNELRTTLGHAPSVLRSAHS